MFLEGEGGGLVWFLVVLFWGLCVCVVVWFFCLFVFCKAELQCLLEMLQCLSGVLMM